MGRVVKSENWPDTPPPADALAQPKFCITEMSIIALLGLGTAFAAMLWLMILLVL